MKPGKDSETSKSEQVEEAAVRWFMRQQSGAWTDADQSQFDTWLGAATPHRIQYLRVTYIWEQSARMKALGAGASPGVIPPRGSWGDSLFFRGVSSRTQPAPLAEDQSSNIETHDEPVAQNSSADIAAGGREMPADAVSQTPVISTQQRSGPARWEGQRQTSETKSRLRFLSAAAAAAVALLAGAIYVLHADLLEGSRYSTPLGGIEKVTLADGSQVTLNTDTRVRVIFSERERRISLDRGEAFFDVAKERSRPFVVYVGDKRVMAVGTQFSVRRDEDDVQVVVTEGRVELATTSIRSGQVSDGLAQRIADVVAEGIGREGGKGVSIPPVTFLDAGSIARTSKSEVLVRSDAQSAAEKLLSWRVGYVSFENVPLADAVAEFNRYNVRKIVIEDPAIAAVLIGGNFRSSNTEAFLDLLQSGFPISVERREDEVILRAR